SLLRLGGRLDVPLEERLAEGARDLLGEQRLAGAGLALDQQRPLEGDRGVDGDLQLRVGDVGVGALELLHAGIIPAARPVRPARPFNSTAALTKGTPCPSSAASPPPSPPPPRSSGGGRTRSPSIPARRPARSTRAPSPTPAKARRSPAMPWCARNA